jgi:hypothetical protein
MKHLHLLFLTLISTLTIGSSFYNKGDDKGSIQNSTEMKKEKIKITVNGQTFTATLLDNHSVKAFTDMLPLTIKMIELHGNEKYGELKKSLPTNPSNPKTITIGDLLLYGDNTLVLFYETFPTSYSYTALGRLDNPTGLASALGSGNVTVTFELE